MKKILAILTQISIFQVPSLAVDIRDFKIEGISIGDSALDYFSKDQIKKNLFDIDLSPIIFSEAASITLTSFNIFLAQPFFFM